MLETPFPRGCWTIGPRWCFHTLKIHPKPCETGLRRANTCSVRTPGSGKYLPGRKNVHRALGALPGWNGAAAGTPRLRVTLHFPPQRKRQLLKENKLSHPLSTLLSESSFFSDTSTDTVWPLNMSYTCTFSVQLSLFLAAFTNTNLRFHSWRFNKRLKRVKLAPGPCMFTLHMVIVHILCITLAAWPVILCDVWLQSALWPGSCFLRFNERY